METQKTFSLRGKASGPVSGRANSSMIEQIRYFETFAPPKEPNSGSAAQTSVSSSACFDAWARPDLSQN